MSTQRLALFISLLLLAGCGFTAPRYSSSPENVIALRRLGEASAGKIAVDPFDAPVPAKWGITCRAVNTVETPDGQPFIEYFRKALVNELQLAGVYDPQAPIRLSGYLEYIDFNAFMGAGRWVIRMRFGSTNTEPFTVEHSYPFTTNFLGDQACTQVAQALIPATQDFLQAVITHPQFQALLRH